MEDTFHLGIKALIRNQAGQILLLKVNYAKLTGNNIEPYWDIPGGRIQRGETVSDTLQREVTEETGITQIDQFEPLGMVLSNIRIPVDQSDVGLILSIYQCSVKKDQIVKISDEHVEFGWFNPHEAAQLLKIKYPPEFTSRIGQLPT